MNHFKQQIEQYIQICGLSKEAAVAKMKRNNLNRHWHCQQIDKAAALVK
jgi:hypothetical protein